MSQCSCWRRALFPHTNARSRYQSVKASLVDVFSEEEFTACKLEVQALLQEAHDSGELAEKRKEARRPKPQPKQLILPEHIVGDPTDSTVGGKTHGCYIAPAAGTIIFDLDNSYSKVRPKKVSYVMEIGPVPHGSVTVETPELQPLLRQKRDGLVINDRMIVKATGRQGLFVEAGVAAGMVLKEVRGDVIKVTSWAALEAQLQAQAKQEQGATWGSLPGRHAVQAWLRLHADSLDERCQAAVLERVQHDSMGLHDLRGFAPSPAGAEAAAEGAEEVSSPAPVSGVDALAESQLRDLKLSDAQTEACRAAFARLPADEEQCGAQHWSFKFEVTRRQAGRQTDRHAFVFFGARAAVHIIHGCVCVCVCVCV
jgi:hypothetical protein